MMLFTRKTLKFSNKLLLKCATLFLNVAYKLCRVWRAQPLFLNVADKLCRVWTAQPLFLNVAECGQPYTPIPECC